MLWIFGPKACGILASQPRIGPTLPALEGEVLTTGPPGTFPCRVCSCHHNETVEHLFHHTRKKLHAHEESFPIPDPSIAWQSLIHFLSLKIRLFWTFHTKGIMQYMIFCEWFLYNIFKFHPCCRKHWYFIPPYGQIIFYCMNILYLLMYASVDECLTCSHFLFILNNVGMKIHVEIFVWIHVFTSLEQILRSRIAAYVFVSCVPSHFNRVQLFATLGTIACQAPLSTGFNRQEYWSGLTCPLQGIFLTKWLNLHLLCLQHCRQILYPLSFSFLGTARLFPKWLNHFAIMVTLLCMLPSYRWVQFPYLLNNTCCCLYFFYRSPSGYEVVFHSFNLHFTDDSWHQGYFHMLIGPLYSLRRNAYSNPLPIL